MASKRELGGGRDAHHGREETADKTRDDPGGGTAEDESDDFAFEVPPMSQARKSFGAEMAKLQMAGASGGVDDEHKFLRGIATLGKDLSCCLCLSTFERPVRTSCKHYYCAECLRVAPEEAAVSAVQGEGDAAGRGGRRFCRRGGVEVQEDSHGGERIDARVRA